jgi:peptidoglycan hydrolase-like protein with peptidoglycan-binding domain
LKVRRKIIGVACAAALIVTGAIAAVKPATPRKHAVTAPKKPASPALAKVSATAKTTHGSKKNSASSKHSKSRVRGQAAPTTDRISEIQSALAKSGAYKGDPSGKWDDGSVDAMKHFQQQNGLAPSGRLDAQTLQKLGLGSDIAGRAAPRLQSPSASSQIRNY